MRRRSSRRKGTGHVFRKAGWGRQLRREALKAPASRLRARTLADRRIEHHGCGRLVAVRISGGQRSLVGRTVTFGSRT
ncbi:hypothetical protein BURCENK562V_C4264 [Burkholderia cenocepacia K56-2Valvano]|nr:hypothetical protein BURCENK562V_C4264 [Burkholderia cenocepacia K56-2Valvano]